MSEEMVSSNSSKLALVLGLIAVLAVVVIVAAAGVMIYLIPRESADPTVPPGRVTPAPAPRVKRPGPVPAADITAVRFTVTTHQSVPTPPSGAFLGNVNPESFMSTTTVIEFSSDGSATKRRTTQSTVKGAKSGITESFAARIQPERFRVLAAALADNDFLNEPDSKTSSSLPIVKTLTIIYSGGEKVITTSNMDDDTPEVEAMLDAFNAVERDTAWKRV